jgi:hypothetical protein
VSDFFCLFALKAPTRSLTIHTKTSGAENPVPHLVGHAKVNACSAKLLVRGVVRGMVKF